MRSRRSQWKGSGSISEPVRLYRSKLQSPPQIAEMGQDEHFREVALLTFRHGANGPPGSCCSYCSAGWENMPAATNA